MKLQGVAALLSISFTLSVAACGDGGGAGSSASAAASTAPKPTVTASQKPSATASAPAPSATVAADCALKPRTKGKGCPDTKAAEAAWKKVESSCKIDVATDIKVGPDEVKLGAAAHDKICASCECANNVQEYASIYSDCTSKTEKENANMGKALAAEVDKCGFKPAK